MIPLIRPVFPTVESIVPALEEIRKSGMFSNQGPCYNAFCDALVSELGFPNVSAVCNGTIAIQLAIDSCGLRGKRVAVPNFTFYGTIQAILSSGCEPVFIDIDSETLTICPDRLSDKISSCDGVLAVDSFGSPCHYRELEDICATESKPLIIDSAGAIGASYRGVSVGGFGDAQCFSLHATKLLPVGEGGLVTSTESIHRKVSSLMNFGLDNGELIYPQGTNAKIDEMHCAVGLQSLKALNKHLSNRRAYARLYGANLDPSVKTQKLSAESNQATHQLFPIVLPTTACRDRVMRQLLEADIGCKVYYVPFTENADTPISFDIYSRIVCIPMHSCMDVSDVMKVCREVNRACLSGL